MAFDTSYMLKMQFLVWQPVMNLSNLRSFPPRNQFIFYHIELWHERHMLLLYSTISRTSLLVLAVGCISMLAVAFRAGKIIAINLVMHTFLKFFLNFFELICCK